MTKESFREYQFPPYRFVRYSPDDARHALRDVFSDYRTMKNYPLALASFQARTAQELLRRNGYRGYFLASCAVGAILDAKQHGTFEAVGIEQDALTVFADASEGAQPVYIAAFSGGHTDQPFEFHTMGYMVSFSLRPKCDRPKDVASCALPDGLASFVDMRQPITIQRYFFQGEEREKETFPASAMLNPHHNVYRILRGEDPEIYAYIATSCQILPQD